MTDWAEVFKLGWKQRDAHIERAIRTVLQTQSGAVTTSTLVALMAPNDVAARPLLAKRLVTMAPYLAPLARHDGPEFNMCGRTMRRWNWYGQQHFRSEP